VTAKASRGDVLVVDDNAVNLDLLSEMLLERGYRVRVATSGRRALAAARSAVPDLVMLDINMPEMDGYEVCRELKTDAATRDVPVIFISALDTTIDKVKAFETGGADYVTKPFQIEEVLARIDIQLRMSRLQRALERKNAELEQSNLQLARANNMLRALSYLDPLTGTANRRHFEESLDQEWRRGMREKTSLALRMVDIDHFKMLNDTNGHQHGDECLRQVAAQLSGSLKRAGDLVARYGGEEFAVLLPNTEVDGAVAIAEAMRAGVESLAIENAEATPPVITVSIGIATSIPDETRDPFALVDTADRALYEAKRNGRNRLARSDAEGAPAGAER
jgi:diguanylate cyclase (GGDEF)-like protein